MRICLYTNSALPKLGGQEIVVDALARQFLALEHEPVVLAPWRDSQGQFDASSVPYPVVWHPRFLSTRRFVSWYGHWLAKLHRSRRFDVIHCHGNYPAGYVGACCGAVRHLPLVITSHGDDIAPQGLYDRKPELRERYHVALATADSAIATSDFAAGLLRQVCPKSLHIADIPNGVDVRRFATPAARPPGLDEAIQPRQYLLFLGRLVALKGIDVLLRAVAAAEGCHLGLVVAGTGPESASLTSLSHRLGLSSRVHFLGLVDDNQKTWLLQNGLCTIVPSRITDACPLVVIESYAAGRPVIATDLPGLRERIQHEQTGLLVAPENPRQLADAIVHLSSQPHLADAWGIKARRFAMQFDWKNIARRHLELFENLAATRQAGGKAA